MCVGFVSFLRLMATGRSRHNSRFKQWLRPAAKEGLLSLLHRFDVHLVRWSTTIPARRVKILNNLRVNVMLDVGAGCGQYGTELRLHGFKGEIFSFEPLGSSFSQLQAVAGSDPGWTCYRLALGDVAGTATLNVASNEVSSSILPMTPRHVSAAPDSEYQTEERVELKRLDDFGQLLGAGRRPALKLDVQGFEDRVLAGAKEIIRSTQVLEIELSLVELYHGAKTYRQMLDTVEASGFRLVLVEPIFEDPATGYALQMNGIFVRS